MSTSIVARWPHRVLGSESTLKQARDLAGQLVSLLGPHPEEWLGVGRFEIRDVPAGKHGGLQALCIPMDNDRFRFVIYGSDTDPNPERRAFLICHEVAHTFFYFRRPGTRPHRAIPARVLQGGNDWEESFCDAFALSAVGLSELPAGLARAGGTA